jgi:hypothetical protein
MLYVLEEEKGSFFGVNFDEVIFLGKYQFIPMEDRENKIVVFDFDSLAQKYKENIKKPIFYSSSHNGLVSNSPKYRTNNGKIEWFAINFSDKEKKVIKDIYDNFKDLI